MGLFTSATNRQMADDGTCCCLGLRTVKILELGRFAWPTSTFLSFITSLLGYIPPTMKFFATLASAALFASAFAQQNGLTINSLYVGNLKPNHL